MIDELRWLQLAKYFRLGFLKKDSFKHQEQCSGKSLGSRHHPTGCKVCFLIRANASVMACERCGHTYHRICYGVPDSFRLSLCDLCNYNNKNNLPVNRINCFICKQHYPGIPFKQFRSNFFHVTCLFIANFGIEFNYIV
jgi:hypothetical protein